MEISNETLSHLKVENSKEILFEAVPISMSDTSISSTPLTNELNLEAPQREQIDIINPLLEQPSSYFADVSSTSVMQKKPTATVGLTVEIRKLRKDEFRDAQRFLMAGSQLSLIKPIDFVYGAFVDHCLVGISRIAPEFEVYLFRGTDLKKSFCDRGFEINLAQLTLEEAKDKDCYALTEAKNMELYTTLGFKVLELDKSPEHLRKRVEQAARQKVQLIAMKKSKG